MVSEKNVRDVALILIALGIIGFFALPDYWSRFLSVVAFAIGAVILIR